MDEISGRFELLRAELTELQQGIRNYDVIRAQVQGWAVTVGLAAAGLALSADAPAAALLGLFSSGAFWAIDGHRRSVQRQLIQRVIDIEQALAGASIAGALSPGAGLRIPGLAHHLSAAHPKGGRLRHMLREAARPGTWALYAALAGVLVVTAVATWL